MLFSSITFLYYFLPCVFLLYFITPARLKNTVLFLVSIVFYAWGEPKYALIMLASIASSYVFALLIEKSKGKTFAKILTGFSVAVSLSFLLFFKYTDFFIDNFNRATGLSVPLLGIALPIGISFYTFQLVSYTVDVYRGVPAQKNPINLGAYITMFPQLIAGPIVRYSDIAVSLKNRRHTVDFAAQGITRFVIGLSKKILLANTLGELCDIFRSCDDKSVLFYWIYAVAYALHVYFDFSGYSDMAIGLGKILGFDFCENFNYPYISTSVSEFWRRWHISLGSWFRDYVYIPMGGNRVNAPRRILNIFTVWFLTGLWHGAAWNFAVWGLYFAVLLTLEKNLFSKLLKRSKTLSRVYVILAVLISFVIFNAADMTQAFSDIASMFFAGGHSLVSQPTLYYLKSYAVLLIVGIIGATPLVKTVAVRFCENEKTKKLCNVLQPVIVAALLLISTAYLADGSFNPFLYFRF